LILKNRQQATRGHVRPTYRSSQAAHPGIEFHSLLAVLLRTNGENQSCFHWWFPIRIVGKNHFHGRFIIQTMVKLFTSGFISTGNESDIW
jgi:hypothetical protein